MKAIFVSLFGVFAITAIITHIWTVIIAFTEAGFFGGVLYIGSKFRLWSAFCNADPYPWA